MDHVNGYNNCSAHSKASTNRYGMDFVSIPAGHFKMDSTNKDRELALKEMLMQNQKRHDMNNYRDEQPQHDGTITRSFLLGRTEITQAQWLKVMENRHGPEEYWQRSDWRELPVVSISWNMAKRFTEALKVRKRSPSPALWSGSRQYEYHDRRHTGATNHR